MTIVDYAEHYPVFLTSAVEKKLETLERHICKGLYRSLMPGEFPLYEQLSLVAVLIGNLLDLLSKQRSTAKNKEISLSVVMHLVEKHQELEMIYPPSKTPSREDWLTLRSFVRPSLLYALDSQDLYWTTSEIRPHRPTSNLIHFADGSQTSWPVFTENLTDELSSSWLIQLGIAANPGLQTIIDRSISKQLK